MLNFFIIDNIIKYEISFTLWSKVKGSTTSSIIWP